MLFLKLFTVALAGADATYLAMIEDYLDKHCPLDQPDDAICVLNRQQRMEELKKLSKAACQDSPSAGLSSAADEACDVSKYVECMEPISNATVGHTHGLFQDAGDLQESCPIIKAGITCIQNYANECGTEMIAENYHEQFERPAEFLTKICDSRSSVRVEYLKASPCMRENYEDFEICSTKVQEFLAFYEQNTEEQEFTMTCMFEMMLRACLMSTGAEKCGIDTASFIRKALLYSPSLGLQTCSKE